MHRRSFLQVSAGAVAMGLSGYAFGLRSKAFRLLVDYGPVSAAEFRAMRRYADTKFGRIAYVDRGRGEAAMFLHGFPLNSFQWRDVIDRLSGYAPMYRETGLTSPEMTLATRAVEFILKQQEPYPAIVMDRHWNLLMVNQGATRLIQFLLGAPPTDRNVVRQVFRDDMLRPFISNWDEVAADMIRRLHQEIDWVPTDKVLQDLLDEVLASPRVPEQWRTRELQTPASPMLTFAFRKDDIDLRFFSTWTTFGAPHDVTLEELRIESSFPADEETSTNWNRIVSS